MTSGHPSDAISRLLIDWEGAIQPGKEVKGILTKVHPIVRKDGRAAVILMAAEDAVFLGNAYHTLDTGQDGDILFTPRCCITDQIEFGQSLQRISLLMDSGGKHAQGGEVHP